MFLKFNLKCLFLIEKVSLNVSSPSLVPTADYPIVRMPKTVPNRREVRSTVLFTTTLGTRGVASICSELYLLYSEYTSNDAKIIEHLKSCET